MYITVSVLLLPMYKEGKSNWSVDGFDGEQNKKPVATHYSDFRERIYYYIIEYSPTALLLLLLLPTVCERCIRMGLLVR